MGYQEVSKKKANLGNGPGNGPIPTPQPVSRLPSILIEPAGGSSSYSTPAAEEADVKSGKRSHSCRAVAVWEVRLRVWRRRGGRARASDSPQTHAAIDAGPSRQFARSPGRANSPASAALLIPLP